MGTISIGRFSYTDTFTENQQSRIPSETVLNDTSSTEAVLIRLLLGKIKIESETKTLSLSTNYTTLPFSQTGRFPEQHFNGIFGTDVFTEPGATLCSKYLAKNRRNSDVHKEMVNELTAYFLEEHSPVSAFVHLYRCLEFMSYSFPMMYAAISKNFKGSYDNLKSFLSGTSTGELKFFVKFLAELFKDETTTLNYTFNIDVFTTDIASFRSECIHVFSNQFPYDFNEGESIFNIKFRNMASLFITLRNRYFHMLIGQGQNNFKASTYDMNDIFKAFNPHFLNWIAIIYVKIIQAGFTSYNE